MSEQSNICERCGGHKTMINTIDYTAGAPNPFIPMVTNMTVAAPNPTSLTVASNTYVATSGTFMVPAAAPAPGPFFTPCICPPEWTFQWDCPSCKGQNLLIVRCREACSSQSMACLCGMVTSFEVNSSTHVITMKQGPEDGCEVSENPEEDKLLIRKWLEAWKTEEGKDRFLYFFRRIPRLPAPSGQLKQWLPIAPEFESKPEKHDGKLHAVDGDEQYLARVGVFDDLPDATTLYISGGYAEPGEKGETVYLDAEQFLSLLDWGAQNREWLESKRIEASLAQEKREEGAL